eukprot:scaffold9665_cov104-Isochrysis_galbana.AAC.2
MAKSSEALEGGWERKEGGGGAVRAGRGAAAHRAGLARRPSGRCTLGATARAPAASLRWTPRSSPAPQSHRSEAATAGAPGGVGRPVGEGRVSVHDQSFSPRIREHPLGRFKAEWSACGCGDGSKGRRGSKASGAVALWRRAHQEGGSARVGRNDSNAPPPVFPLLSQLLVAVELQELDECAGLSECQSRAAALDGARRKSKSDMNRIEHEPRLALCRWHAPAHLQIAEPNRGETVAGQFGVVESNVVVQDIHVAEADTTQPGAA